MKKIPPDLRRKGRVVPQNGTWHKRIFWRLREDSQYLRSFVQLLFTLLCIWIGIEFFLFIRWGTSGGEALFYERPPGVEGFLPISALISLKYWLDTSIINDVHPAGLFILLAIVLTSLFLKKAFCSWLCPVGTLSESLWMLGRKLVGRNITITPWLDYPLRSLKYLLLFFFVFSIWQMDVTALRTFIYSPYNKMADVKMWYFFAEITTFSLWTIIILMIFSLFVKNFWCRYLCPYGALLGAISWLSPFKITRTSRNCIDCELCSEACPSDIKVHKAARVWSDECMSCLACVQACPVKDTLDMRVSGVRARIPTPVFAFLLVGVFMAITGVAMLGGFWKNAISREEYLFRFPQIHTPLYQHNRGTVPDYTGDD